MKTYDETIEERERTKGLIGAFILYSSVSFFGLIIFLCVFLPRQERASRHNIEILAKEEGQSFGKNKAFREKYREDHNPSVYMNK